MKNEKRTLGIYIHIPFCVSKCAYCDFVSYEGCYNEIDKYVEYLIKEIELCSITAEDYVVRTCFFGGGTPSSIDAGYIKLIMHTLKRRFVFAEDAEISIECNPNTISTEKLKIYKEAGINRISIGLQSADNEELKELGRIHTYEEFLESYELVRIAGFNNINIDIMSGLMYQTTESFKETLNKVIALEPEHISAYSLIIEEGTPLAIKLERFTENGIDVLPSSDEERRMYYLTEEILSKAGYERYEISNYSKSGMECKHNVAYWDRQDYAGFGIAAASLLQNKRITNVSTFEEYYKCIEEHKMPVDTYEMLTTDNMMEEFMFLGLRKCKGVSKKVFYETFGKEMDDVYGEINEKYKALKLLEDKDGMVFLTKQGIDVSNVIMSEYLLD